MTQRNIDIMDLIVDKLAEGKSISVALKDVYKIRHISIPFDDRTLNISLHEIGLSRKVTYALIRGGMFTVADVVKYCERNKLTAVKQVGIGAGIETFEAILNYLWKNMSANERVEFLIDTIEKNEENLREELM